MKLIKILLFAVFFIHYSVFSQEYKCYSCETGYPGEYFEIFTLQDSIIIRDTVRDTVFLSMYDMEKATKSLVMSFDEFVHNFLTYVNSRDSSTMTPEEITMLFATAAATFQRIAGQPSNNNLTTLRDVLYLLLLNIPYGEDGTHNLIGIIEPSTSYTDTEIWGATFPIPVQPRAYPPMADNASTIIQAQ